jgi:hypothetical protein
MVGAASVAPFQGGHGQAWRGAAGSGVAVVVRFGLVGSGVAVKVGLGLV